MSQCPRVRAPGACTLVLLLVAGPAVAQTDCRTTEPVLTHPVELGHGPATGARYAAAARVHPLTVGLGCDRALRLGPTAALLYAARELDVVAGGHVTVRVAQLARGLAYTPLGLSAEALFGSRRRSFGGALTVEPLRLGRIGVRVHRDTRARLTTGELFIGITPRIVSPRIPRVPLTVACPGFDGFHGIVCVRTASRASWLDDEPEAGQRAARAAIERAAAAADVAEFTGAIVRDGFDRLAASVLEAVAESRVSARNEGIAVPDERDPAVRRRTVEAIVVGVRTALGGGG